MSDLFTSIDDSTRYVRVAIERNIDSGDGGLTYAAGPEVGELQIGDRVYVPLGKAQKRVAGYVIGFDAADRVKSDKIRFVLERDPFSVSLTDDLMTLARWIASYYCSPLGMVLASMLPAAVKRASGRVRRVEVSLAPKPTVANEEEGKTKEKKSKGLTARHRAVLETLAAEAEKRGTKNGPVPFFPEWFEVKALADMAGLKSTAAIKTLIERGLLVMRRTEHVDPAWIVNDEQVRELAVRHELNPAQQAALDKVAATVDTPGFAVFLLHGVTGSGKTEVYLRVIEHVLGRGKESGVPGAGWALVLVPEIALTPQTVARFKSRFGSRVAVLHSGLTGAQRNEQWRQVRAGEASIVVGARSAVFAPISIPGPGIIIVDEEHESSYKQDQAPRYHARDVAIRRGQIMGVPVLLGSATPSLESYWNAMGETRRAAIARAGAASRDREEAEPAGQKKETGSLTVAARAKESRSPYHLLSLPSRVAGIRLPKVQIIDMAAERKNRRGIHLLSLRLEDELTRTLQLKSQTILLLNRRGYASYIACPDHRCGWMMTCELCDATMVYHKDAALPLGGLVRCHHCTAEQILPTYCPTCSKKVTTFGLGTQRVEEELSKKFPEARTFRMDSDAMRKGADYQRCLALFGAGEIDILVGTQMIAKGLDFPNVRLVGVINADTALHMPDFRAGERTFSLIAQVAGRAGRGDPAKVGTVIVQSFSPEDPAIVLASKHDYETFANQELQIRYDTGLPPVKRMARIVIRHVKPEQCFVLARQVADMLEEQNALLGNKVRVRGPSPCPIARIAGYHRHQIELIASDAATMQKLLTAVRNARGFHADAKMAVDVDPVVML